MTARDEYDKALDPELAVQTNSMPIERAFVIILAGAVHADDKVKSVELIELEALLARITTLKAMSDADRQRLYDEIYPLMRQRSTRIDQVKLACTSVIAARDGKHPGVPRPSPQIAESVFAHACDLLCSDHSVPDAERRFLGTLRERLEIAPDRAQHIMRTIALKNRH